MRLIVGLLFAMVACNCNHTLTKPPTKPNHPEGYTISARVVIDQDLAEEAPAIKRAAQRWNRDLGCEVFSFDQTYRKRTYVFVIKIGYPDSESALARAGWYGTHGIIYIFELVKPELQEQIYRHELGHILGLNNLYGEENYGDLMFGVAYVGTADYHISNYTETTTVKPDVMRSLQKLHCGKEKSNDRQSKGNPHSNRH